MSEASEQEVLIEWCELQKNIHPALALIFHIPNGGSRNVREAVNLKRQGVKAGVPDLFLPVAKGGYNGLFIEMKYGKNKTSKKQEWWLGELGKQGYKAVVCYGFEEGKREILQYLGARE